MDNFIKIKVTKYLDSNYKVTYLCETKAKNMNTTEIRKKVADYMEVGFTMKEAFACIKDAARKSRKTSKVADAIAASQERAGTYEYGFSGKEYGFSGKEYGNRKWGKQ